MFNFLNQILTDRSGATLIEYGLVAGMVAISATAGLTLTGEFLTTIFDAVAGDMTAAAASR